VHPLNQDEAYDVEDLRRLAAEEGVVAMGETGLDYFYTRKPNRASSRSEPYPHWPGAEQAGYRAYPRCARRYAGDPTEEKVTDCGGVLHCFTEDRETAGKLLDMGFYISFSGIVTFRNAEQLRDAARYVPLDRCWWRPILRTWRRYRIAAKRTSRHDA
jgi:TatD DNase family protein